MLSSLVLIVIVASVVAYKSMRRRYYLTGDAIPTPKYAPWMKLFNSGDNSSFICLTGFDYATFHEIHDIVFEGAVPKVRGRKPK